MNLILIQFIGAIGYTILALSYYKKEKNKILFLQIISAIMFTIHYYLLNGITGAICNLISLNALIVIYLFDKYKLKYKSAISIIFIILLIGINISTFQNIFSIFPMIASVAIIASFLTDNEDIIRATGLIAAVCWLIYAIVYKSYIAIIFEIVTLTGILIAFVTHTKNPSFKIKSKEKNNK